MIKLIVFLSVSLLSIRIYCAESIIIPKGEKSSLVLSLVEYQGKVLSNPTKIKMYYDDNNLYLQFVCFEQNMQSIVGNYRNIEERDNKIWLDDSVDVVISPYGNRDLYHFIVNSNGIVFDAVNKNNNWNSNITVSTDKKGDRWLVNLIIPFKDFGFIPKGGESWRIHIGRSKINGMELSALDAIQNGGGFLAMERLRKIIFSGDSIFAMESLMTGDQAILSAEIKETAGKTKNIEVTVENSVNGKNIFLQTQKYILKPNSLEKLNLNYLVQQDKNKVTLTVIDLTENHIVYRNSFWVDLAENAIVPSIERIWKVNHPKYAELLSNIPYGLMHDGSISWSTSRNYSMMRNFALQYGEEYIYSAEYDLAAKNKMLNITNQYLFTAANYNSQQELKRSGAKEIILPDFRNAQTVKTAKGEILLIDPVAKTEYLANLDAALDADANKSLWGLLFFDEAMHINLRIAVELFSDKKQKYEFIQKLDEKIKEKYGDGKFGIPESINDQNPYRWIALWRIMNDEIYGFMNEVKQHLNKRRPDMVMISDDPQGAHSAYDLSRWEGKCDIATHQLYPKLNKYDVSFGFLTKLLSDLSGVKEIWPCPHIEEYAASFTPIEVVRLLSQVIANGGTGFHWYNIDTVGVRSKYKAFKTEIYGAPDRWQTVLNVLDNMQKSAKPMVQNSDSAIFYSCDTISSFGLQLPSNEIPNAYALLGPLGGYGAFTFINDYQLNNTGFDLSKYKVIFIPMAKFERVGVIKTLKEYVNAGGIIVSFDPEVFTSDTVGNDTSSIRQDIFGIKLKNKIPGDKIKYDGKYYEFAERYAIDLMPNASVVKTFEDNRPFLVTQDMGKGKTYYFTSNPCSGNGYCNETIRAYICYLQKDLKLKTSPIWDFELPLNLAANLPLRKDMCITNNSQFWRSGNPVTKCNVDADTKYTYSTAPNEIADIDGANVPISSNKGKLTNRCKAASAGNVDAGIGSIKDWVVRFKDTPTFDINWQFKQKYEVNSIVLIMSGDVPEVNVYAIDATGNYKSITSATIPSCSSIQKDDVRRVVIDLPSKFSTDKLKMKFTQLRENNCLTISEIEIWAK